MSDRPTMPVVVVTGASGLIGRALVRRFAESGATVVATDVAPAVPLPPGAHVHVHADLATRGGRQALLDRAIALGGPTVVVHNAAVTTFRGRLVDSTDDELEDIWRVNVGAVVSLSRMVLQHWRSTGVPGVLVMMCSPGGERAHANQGLYDVTKGALASLVRVVAVESGPDGVRACGVSPGALAPAEGPSQPDVPLRRPVTPDLVADTVVWLASEQAAGVTGVVVPVDGGLLAQLRTPTTPSVPAPSPTPAQEETP